VRNIIEKAFVVFALLFFADAGLTLIENPHRDPLTFAVTASDPVKTAVAVSVYLVLLAFGLPRYSALIDAFRRNKLLVSLIALSAVSASWSPEPASSAKRAVLLLATTLFGAYFGVRFEPLEQLKLLSLTMTIAIGASFAFALCIPAYGTDNEMAVAWRGVFDQKNEFGRAAVLSVIVFFFMSKQPRSRRWFWHTAIVLALGAVVLSRSATAVVVLLAVGVSFMVLSLFRLPQRLLIEAACLSLALATCAVALLSANTDSVFKLLGRDATLTGRTEIWSALAAPIGRHLWFGYGYGGFWLGPGSDSESVTEQVHWAVQHAHNGFLDLTLQLGCVGITIFALLFLQYFTRALRSARSQSGYLCLWPLCYFAFMFFYNFTDNTIVAHNNVFWVLFVGIGLQIGQTDVRDHRPVPTRTLFHGPARAQILAGTSSQDLQ
jgi:O-antigen ligase